MTVEAVLIPPISITEANVVIKILCFIFLNPPYQARSLTSLVSLLLDDIFSSYLYFFEPIGCNLSGVLVEILSSFISNDKIPWPYTTANTDMSTFQNCFRFSSLVCMNYSMSCNSFCSFGFSCVLHFFKLCLGCFTRSRYCSSTECTSRA